VKAAAVLARLTWKRLRRGRALWLTGFLLLVPVIVALSLLGQPLPGPLRWRVVLEITLRILVLLAAAVHLAPAVAEELDGKTYTYLWSRPVPRWAVVAGKLMAVAPLLVLGFTLSIAAAFPIAAGGDADALLPALGRLLAAACAGVIAASAVSVGAGALFPRHPLVVVLGYFLVVEQALPFIPVVGNLSIFYHLGAVAEVAARGAGTHSPAAALGGLLLLSLAWAAVGLWRVGAAEYAGEDR
jgi:hypothetical protein